jgi:hypothetical protein
VEVSPFEQDVCQEWHSGALALFLRKERDKFKVAITYQKQPVLPTLLITNLNEGRATIRTLISSMEPLAALTVPIIVKVLEAFAKVHELEENKMHERQASGRFTTRVVRFHRSARSASSRLQEIQDLVNEQVKS